MCSHTHTQRPWGKAELRIRWRQLWHLRSELKLQYGWNWMVGFTTLSLREMGRDTVRTLSVLKWPVMHVCVHAQSCLTLRDLTDCSLPSSSVHGILQARILEWVAMPSSLGSSQLRDPICLSPQHLKSLKVSELYISHMAQEHSVMCSYSASLPICRFSKASGLRILLKFLWSQPGGKKSEERRGTFPAVCFSLQASFISHPHSTGQSTVMWF